MATIDASRRGDRASPGADPDRYDESAGKRDPRGRAAARLPRAARRSVRALCAGPRASEPRRTDPRSWRRADAALPVPHGRRPRGPRGVAARPVRRRGSRRRGLGPRRARHEGSGRGGSGRARIARAGGLRAVRRPDLRSDRRRGGRRGFGARGSAKSIPTPSAPTTASTRGQGTGSSSPAGPTGSVRPRRR